MSRGGGPHPAASVLAAMGMPVARRCSCGEPVTSFDTPETRGRCVACLRVESEERRQLTIAERVRVRVPAVYRWATLDPGGALERAASGRSVAIVREWLADATAPPILLLRGVTHVYKSTLAAACVRYETEQGRDAAFVLGVDLAPLGERPTEEQRIRLGNALHLVDNMRSLVVIDDPSKALGGAAAESSLAAYRRGHFCAATHRRWQAKARTILTTDLENRATPERRAPGIVELFGEDQLARWTDQNSAIVVRLERRR